MGLPNLKKCCWYLPIQSGCIIIITISIFICLAFIAAGLYILPGHDEMQNEDNVVIMNVVMFSMLSLISNVICLIGIVTKRPGFVQLSWLTNCVFSLCLFLVAIVTCLFSPYLRQYYWPNPGYIVLAIVILLLGAAYTLYYLTIVSSQYMKMKGGYGSAIPI